MSLKFIVEYATASEIQKVTIEAKNLSAAKMLIRKQLNGLPANIWIRNEENHILSSSIFNPRNIHQSWKDTREAEPCYLRPGDHVVYRKDNEITGIVDRRQEQYILTHCYIVLSIKINNPDSLSSLQKSQLGPLDKYGILRGASSSEWTKLWHDSSYCQILTNDVLRAEYEENEKKYLSKQ